MFCKINVKRKCRNVILTGNASIFVDVVSAVMMADKNASGSVKSFIINNTVGNGVAVSC